MMQHANMFCPYDQHEDHITIRSFMIPQKNGVDYVEVDREALHIKMKMIKEEVNRRTWWVDHLQKDYGSPPCSTCDIACPGFGLSLDQCKEDIMWKQKSMNTDSFISCFSTAIQMLERPNLPINKPWKIDGKQPWRRNPQHNPRRSISHRLFRPAAGGYSTSLLRGLFMSGVRETLPPSISSFASKSQGSDDALTKLLDSLPHTLRSSFQDTSAPPGKALSDHWDRHVRLVSASHLAWLRERAAERAYPEDKPFTGFLACFSQRHQFTSETDRVSTPDFDALGTCTRCEAAPVIQEPDLPPAYSSRTERDAILGDYRGFAFV